MSKKRRIVLLLDAGFPMPWGAPSSNELKSLVLDCCKNKCKQESFIETVKDFSFEEILASLYALYFHSVDRVQEAVFNSNFTDDFRTESVGCVFRDCINEIMKRISDYENNCAADEYANVNSNLSLFFNRLKSSFDHVSVYTTNYDEMLPRILGWKENAMSIKGEKFIYDPISFHRKKMSYSNLHGSIHLERRRRKLYDHEIVHIPCRSLLGTGHAVYGGNPGGQDLFTPIIAGHHKTQMIMSEHFNYPLVCFANDLSDADTILTIGYSFSDLHINAMMHQYTIGRNICAIIVDKKNDECLSDDAHRGFLTKISDVFNSNEKYVPDYTKSAFYVYKNDSIVFYKNGVEAFLSDPAFWEKYIYGF